MYVVEGSTLGGQVLSRHFADRLGVSPDRGGGFFHGYGEATGRMWMAFAGLAASRPESETGPAIDAAIATFEALGDWLRGPSAGGLDPERCMLAASEHTPDRRHL